MSEFTLPGWIALIAGVLLVLGGLLSVLGAIGLLRLRSFYDRMHPATMAPTLGSGCVLISSMLVSSALLGRPVVHELAITVFVVMTSVVSATILIRASIVRSRKDGNAGKR